jgi:hypothetical protein
MKNSFHQLTNRRVTPVVYALLGLMMLAIVAGAFLKGEVAEFWRQSWDATMMALIGVLAYLGLKSRIACLAAWLLLGVLLSICVICNTAMAAMIVAAGSDLKTSPCIPWRRKIIIDCYAFSRSL